MKDKITKYYISGYSEYTVGFLGHWAFLTEAEAKAHFILCTDDPPCNEVQRVISKIDT